MATIKRFNNAFGTTTDSPLGSSATTMNSQELPRLGVVDSANSEIARLTLDPERSGGAPEIIHVTDYDGTATSATIERGKEGTTAREHASGTTWEHGPTREDVNAGEENGTDSVAVGDGSVVTHDRTVVVGVAAADETTLGSDDSVFIGYQAGAVTRGNDSVVIGSGAEVTDRRGVAIGEGASSAAGAVSIGRRPTASDADAISIGLSTSSSAIGAIAIGAGASATHQDTVVLGRNLASSDADQVHIGPHHFALTEVADPATPPADEVRLYARDDGSGTSELVVIFPSGNSTVLATGSA